MSWSIAFLGTFHPAEKSLLELVRKNWISIVVLPESAGEKNNALIDICNDFKVPYTFEIRDIEDWEINLVIAANYPKLVPLRFLEKYPCINTHWSDLPKYRGVHGTAWSLLNADYKIGCTVHWMEAEFDTGDVIKTGYCHMSEEMDINELHKQLGELQANLLIETLSDPDIDNWPRITQNEKKSSYVPQRFPEDGLIEWNWPTERIWNLVRALPSPIYPGAFTYLKNQKLIIRKAEPVESLDYFCNTGQVVRVIKGEGVWVKTGDTCLLVKQVQHENSEESLSADKVLKRGVKLGFNYQAVIDSLHHRITNLEKILKNKDSVQE